jgi:phosphorylase/glycogen(starch) synthase
VSWEVANKVGGIYTVLSTKAKTAVAELGDDYVCVGPWLLADIDRRVPFEDDANYVDFAEACRQMGTPVRVGRWLVPGQPRCVLVEFSQLYKEKDTLLAKLWEDYKVDSIAGGWDYAEPVLFGVAAGRVIEEWWERYVAPQHRRSVIHCHEWMTGSALLHVKDRIPAMGTVFTTHATNLGRSLSALGQSPLQGLGGDQVEELARKHGMVAKHSMEGAVAREADVFTTVSQVTADEAELLHQRRPEPVLPNGIDLEVLDSFAGDADRAVVRGELERLATRFLGEEVGEAAFVCVSGRYEFHNKGIDLLLDSLGMLNARDGRRIVLFVLVPAGNSGPRSDVLDRLLRPELPADVPLGVTTHNLFDEERDPIVERCNRLGLKNARGARAKVIRIPIYLTHDDGFLNRPYEAIVRAMDLTVFPSFYEPWGYTPQESIALGVPTVTTDYAGFGRWAVDHGLGPESGITVIHRIGVQYGVVVEALADAIERLIAPGRDVEQTARACRRTAARTAWSDLFAHYKEAYRRALDRVGERMRQGVPQRRRPKATIALQPRAGAAPRLTTFEVAVMLPEKLTDLDRLSRNYWWSWNRDAEALFAELSPKTWEASRRNPVAFLQRLDAGDLARKASDRDFGARLHRVMALLDSYMAERSHSFALTRHEDERDAALTGEHPIAYFCAEYALHESLPIYSGGLGVLAGDHLKSASDLNLPLVGVGLFYHMGYMFQQLGAGGEQVALEVENVVRELPMELLRDIDGSPLEIAINLPGRELFLRAYKVMVGRVTLYLLDANTASNRPEDRGITRNLYGGDQEMRIRQLIALGRGGVRLLRRIGIRPAVYHMNEGHAAFLTLERVSRLVRQEGLTFEAARHCVRATTLFTTHTPVPAGHDSFSEDLMRRYFSDAPEWVGVPWERFFGLGHAKDGGGAFNMTYLALSFSSYCNGVSRLHGVTSQKLLHAFWPGLLEAEVPVRSITNGVHLATWTHPRIARLLGATDRPVRPSDFSRRGGGIDSGDLWEARQANRRDLLERVRASLQQSFVRRNDSPLVLNRVLDGLREDALLIGFARRFAPYKRAQLLYKDAARLLRILDSVDRPVRVLVAGKAHPRDAAGMDVLKGVAQVTRRDEFLGKVVFLEEYDVGLARALVQGVDVWLNTPTHMLEASGTSGMKAAANGVLNISIADGWWPEAYDGKNGWQIGGARLYTDQELQDQFDSATLYRLLEEEVVPLFFDRDEDGVPRGWLDVVRGCLSTIPPAFNTDRMVGQYLDEAYRVLGLEYFGLKRDRRASAKRAADERVRIMRGFAQMKVVALHMVDPQKLGLGDALEARVEIDLGQLNPEDVVVEFVLCQGADERALSSVRTVQLRVIGNSAGRVFTFEGNHILERSGSYSCGLRVRARDSNELVLWA